MKPVGISAAQAAELRQARAVAGKASLLIAGQEAEACRQRVPTGTWQIKAGRGLRKPQIDQSAEED